MKTLATWVLGIAAGLAINGAGLAEAFNDRGVDFTATLEVGAATTSMPDTVDPRGFNDRGQHFVAQVPAGSSEPARDAYITPRGFKNRGRGYFELANP